MIYKMIGIFTLLFLIAVVSFFGYWFYQTYAAHVRISNGKVTNGTLWQHYKEITWAGSKKFEVSYSFDVNGTRYDGTSTTGTTPATTQVQVRYDPLNPRSNKVEDGRDEFEEWESTVVTAVVVGLILSGYVAIRRKSLIGGFSR